MKVRATRLGYYGHKRQREGAIFVLKDVKVGGKEPRVIKAADQFSDKWMEKMPEDAEVKEVKRAKERKAVETAKSGSDDTPTGEKDAI